MKVQSLSDSLESMLKTADSWLSDDEAPLVAALRVMAGTLDRQQATDDGITPSLMSQYTMTLARLYKMKPPAKLATPQLNSLLSAARGDDA